MVTIKDLMGRILIAMIMICIIYAGTIIVEIFGIACIVGFAIGMMLGQLAERRQNEEEETEEEE